MVEGFRGELAAWEKQWFTWEQESSDRLSLQETDNHGLRRTLEKKAGDIQGFHRTLVGIGDQVTAARTETTSLRSYTVERIDVNRDKVAKLRDEFEQRMSTVENQMHYLQDCQTTADSHMQSVTDKVEIMHKQLGAAEENIADLWRNKASVGNLEEQQSDLSDFMIKVNGTVSALKLQFGSLVSDLKSHFQEASDVVGAHTAIQLEAMRAQYKKDLEKTDVVQQDMQTFVDHATKERRSITDELAIVSDTAEQGIDGLQKSVDALAIKSKVADDDLIVEIAKLRNSISGMQAVVQREESLSEMRANLIQNLVESQMLSAMCDLQDDNDRQNIALFGYKDAGGGGGGGASPGKTGGLLPDVHDGGSQSARGSRRLKGSASGPTTASNHASTGGVGQVLSLDKRCLSCSGTQSTLLAGFKMACLSYAPGQIEYGSATYSRGELITQRFEMLKHAKAQLKSRWTESTT